MNEPPSIFGELKATKEYGLLSEEQLFERALYFSELDQTPELGRQARKEVKTILGRIVFELMWREHPVEVVITTDNTSDSV